MSDLAAALRDKISALEDEKEELEDSLARIELKLETFVELLAEEIGESSEPPKLRKKVRGRPKGVKNKKAEEVKKSSTSSAPADSLWEEASRRLPDGSKGSTPEDQARALKRFNPTPRPSPNYGVKAGTPEQVMGTKVEGKKSNVNINVED